MAAAGAPGEVGGRYNWAMVVIRSQFPVVRIPDLTLTGYVLRDLERLRDRKALVDGPSGRNYTFGELDEQVRRLAGGLHSRGMRVGEVLALMAPNIPEFAIVLHGVAMAGGTVTTINPTYTVGEVRRQLLDAGVTRLVTVPEAVATARQAVTGTEVTEMYVIGDSEDVPEWKELFGNAMTPEAEVEIDLDEDLAIIPYSSGTTGLPKGVMLTHRSLVTNLVQSEPALGYDPGGEVALAVLPFFHIYGLHVLMNTLLAAGATVVTMPRFDLRMALSLIEEHRVTQFFAVPPMVMALARDPIVTEYDLSSLRMIMAAAAPLGVDIAEEAAARVGCELTQAYGMTEVLDTHVTPPGANRVGSSGLTIAGVECRVCDIESGRELDIGQEGELWIRNPQVMKGYLNNPEATRETIDAEGWVRTGDVVRFDRDGYMFVVDRVKEIIKYKGFQVAPAELEALTVTHPAVADVAVIGIPDVEAGELPKAFVVLEEGQQATAEEIQEFVAGQVATYKRIRMVEFIDEIPRSPSGKILRRFLRDKG